MKKAFLFLGLVLAMTACQKSIVPPPDLTPPAPPSPPTDTLTGGGIDTIRTPFLQRTLVKLDAHHADSALLQLPHAYNVATNTEKYPLLIFFNGVYEGSDYGNLNKLLKLGPPKFMADSLRFVFKVGGKKERLIVLCPQSERGFRTPKTTNQIIDYMIAHYRVDVKRIYLTGLSAGATSLFRYITHKQEFANRIAAVVPMSTTYIDSTHHAQLHFINDANVHTYMFCGNKDKRYLRVNQSYANAINKRTPGLAQLTLYNGAHKSWNPMYSIGHKFYDPNMYEWLLQFSK
jgi:predicted peptidase